jgi:hypothetical protein
LVSGGLVAAGARLAQGGEVAWVRREERRGVVVLGLAGGREDALERVAGVLERAGLVLLAGRGIPLVHLGLGDPGHLHVAEMGHELVERVLDDALAPAA